MSDTSIERIRTLGLVLLTVLTLGLFKSVYRKLGTPFRQLFLGLIATAYGFLLSLAAFCAITWQLHMITDHFTEMRPLLAEARFGYAIFGAVFAATWITMASVLHWYFNEITTHSFARILKKQCNFNCS